jgi:uncharacterized protein
VALILDTGPLLAALDAADPAHEACAELLIDSTEDLVVPALVLAEVDYWCHQRLSAEAWLVFFDDVIGGVYGVEAPTDRDLRRARELQATYEHLRLGVVDASVIALAERLGETRVATLDRRHFSVVRPVHAHAFEIVP